MIENAKHNFIKKDLSDEEINQTLPFFNKLLKNALKKYEKKQNKKYNIK